MKIYVLIEDSGDYEERSKTILGVYSKSKLAQNAMKEYEELIESYKIANCQDKNGNEKEYMEWVINNGIAMYFNRCFIEEHELIEK